MGAMRYRFFEDWAITGGMGTGLTEGVGSPDWRFFIGFSGQWVTGGWWHVDYAQPGFRAEMDPCDERLTDQTGRRLRFNPPDCPDMQDEEPTVSHADRVAFLERTRPPASRRRQPPPPPMAEDNDEDGGGGAVLRQGMIFITEQVNFGVGSADILMDSFSILDDVVRILRRHEDITLIRIEGHTDSVGRPSNNLRLSRQRAESVRQYMIDRGIEENRVEAIGYGDSQPGADNATEEGRAEKRRVEFNILERGSGESR
jgi:outer membrane protein OmpA-like peptidoglycan-associated protein